MPNANDPCNFSYSTGKRIIKATKHVESQQRFYPRAERAKYPVPQLGQQGFWAQIVDKDPMSSGKYSFKSLAPQTSSPWLVINPDWTSGLYSDPSGYAVEAGGSTVVLKNSIVWMESALTQDYFIFRYSPGGTLAKTSTVVTPMGGITPGSGHADIYTMGGTTTGENVL